MRKLQLTLLMSAVVIALGLSVNLIVGTLQAFGKELTTEDISTLPYEEIEKQLPTQHPAVYMGYAGRVFARKSKEKGVFWFYVGQLRYRFHLAANPDLAPDGDPAIFSSLKSMIGEPINKFAGSDPDLWMKMIDKALSWDAKNENSFTSKEKHKDEYNEVRAGLEKLKAYIGDHKQEILDRDKMPKDWPALVDLKSVTGLEGDYSTKSFFLLPVWLFGEELSDDARDKADVVRIVRESDSSILAIAIAEGEELGRRVVTLDEADGGYSFTDKKKAEEWGLHEGGSTTVITLFRNTEGDMILKWVFTIFGKKTSDGPYSEDVSVSWERALESEEVTGPVSTQSSPVSSAPSLPNP